ncbi:protein of unknown function [Shewanella benthica]|uniref:Uncharacterized protein n=1 Tax=Shewanella benthica TaxID=43661 RepID=A0A330M7L6_9GAMM|nr:protein of unknown function [Shewanella benthica]
MGVNVAILSMKHLSKWGSLGKISNPSILFSELKRVNDFPPLY